MVKKKAKLNKKELVKNKRKSKANSNRMYWFKRSQFYFNRIDRTDFTHLFNYKTQ